MTENVENSTDSAARRIVTISNSKGLHARASAKFVKCAEGFDAWITVSRNSESVSGTSIMGLLMLAAGPGSEIEIAATGADAHDSIEALAALVESQFEEK